MKDTDIKRKFLMIIALFTIMIFLIGPVTAQIYTGSLPIFTSRCDTQRFYYKEILNHTRNIQFTYVTANGNVSQVCKYFDTDVFRDDGKTHSLMGDYIRYNLFDGYTADCEYYQKDGAYYYTFQYKVSYKTTQIQENRFEAALKDTLKVLNLEKMTDYEKVKTIYDYICSEVEYDQIHDSNYTPKYTAYAALIDHSAVCQGYASLFYRMCRESGIQARIISGSAKNEKHAWNIVRIGNVYYNVDATWDAGQPKYAYFLKSNSDFNDHERNAEYTAPSFEAKNPMAFSNYLRN